jgi:hypothetical protein
MAVQHLVKSVREPPGAETDAGGVFEDRDVRDVFGHAGSSSGPTGQI